MGARRTVGAVGAAGAAGAAGAVHAAWAGGSTAGAVATGAGR